MLPPGLWQWRVAAQVPAAEAYTFPASASNILPFEVYLDQMEYDPDLTVVDGSQPFVYEGYYNPFDLDRKMPFISGYADGDDEGEWRFGVFSGSVVNDTTTDQPFAIVADCLPGWTSDVHIVYYDLIMMRVQ